jgi:hypothetical protein
VKSWLNFRQNPYPHHQFLVNGFCYAFIAQTVLSECIMGRPYLPFHPSACLISETTWWVSLKCDESLGEFSFGEYLSVVSLETQIELHKISCSEKNWYLV